MSVNAQKPKMSVTAQKPKKSVTAQKPKSSFIPWLFVGGLGIVVAVNGFMVWTALATAPGLVTDKPYDHGAAYNAVLAQGEAQDRLGWKIETRLDPASPMAGTLRLRVSDASGAGLSGLGLAAELVRPVEKLAPVKLSFTETDRGEYTAPIAVPRPGQWTLFAILRRGGDEFDYSHRIQLR